MIFFFFPFFFGFWVELNNNALVVTKFYTGCSVLHTTLLYSSMTSMTGEEVSHINSMYDTNEICLGTYGSGPDEG